MPDIHQILVFSIAALLIVLVPGPNMMFLISCAINNGKRAAIVALLGSNTALLTLSIIVGAGLGALLRAVPILYDIIKIAGALYLFWLAWKNIRAGAPAKAGRVITAHHKLFFAGFFTNLLNPKAAAFYIAIFPAFLNANAGHIVVQSATLGMVHALVSFLVNGTIIISVKHAGRYFRANNRVQHVIRWLTATIFVAFGIRMLLQKHG